MDLIKRLFGGNDRDNGASAAPVMTTPAAAPEAHDFDAQLNTRRELVRVRTRNTMRLSGIPEAWLEPQLLLEPEGGRTFLHLRLVVRHWDERLLRYGFAFQTKLMSEIERIDPQASEWLLSIVWCYPPDMVCGFPELPQPSEWIDSRPVPLEPDELQADLAQFYRVRDAELSRPAGREGGRRV